MGSLWVAYNCAAKVGKLSPRTIVGKSAREPPIQQIADWLKKLGMSEYAQRFAENGMGGADGYDRDAARILRRS